MLDSTLRKSRLSIPPGTANVYLLCKSIFNPSSLLWSQGWVAMIYKAITKGLKQQHNLQQDTVWNGGQQQWSRPFQQKYNSGDRNLPSSIASADASQKIAPISTPSNKQMNKQIAYVEKAQRKEDSLSCLEHGVFCCCLLLEGSIKARLPPILYHMLSPLEMWIINITSSEGLTTLNILPTPLKHRTTFWSSADIRRKKMSNKGDQAVVVEYSDSDRLRASSFQKVLSGTKYSCLWMCGNNKS